MRKTKIIRRFQLRYAVQIAAVLVGTLVALFLEVNLWAAAAAFLMAMVTGYAMGIFHHMLLSHGSFRASPLLEAVGATLGTLTWRGPMAGPIRYVALHRMHHRFSDQEADPHSPTVSLWHGWLGWMWRFEERFVAQADYGRLAPKLMQKPFLRFLDRNVDGLQLAYGIAVFAMAAGIAQVIPTASGATSPMVIGLTWALYMVFVKTAFILLLANAVDVVNHGVGYRNYATKDLSTNSALMGMVHLGGAISWHNNHHAHPQYFSVRKYRWEIDMHYQVLRLFKLFGWVGEIKVLDDREQTPAPTLRDLHRKSTYRIAALIGGRVALWAGTLTAMITAQRYFSLPVAVMAVVVLVPVAAIALQNIALLGHEGTHFNLSVSRLRSARLGNWLSALVPGHFNLGFAISHAQHHKNTNTANDPDLELFGDLSSLPARLFLARARASRAYARLTFAVAKGQPPAVETLGFDMQTLRRLARENIAAVVLSYALYGTLAVIVGWPAVIALALSFVAAFCWSSLRPYFEHAGTDFNEPARTFSSPFLDLLFGGINYHHAHHQYPGVPVYRIKDLQAFLDSQGRGGQIRVHSASELWRSLGREAYPYAN
jgi:fatty-acid desaturase